MPAWKPGIEIKCNGCERTLVSAEGEVEHAYMPVHSRVRHEGTRYDDDGGKYELYDVPSACLGSAECVEKIEASDKWAKRTLAGLNTPKAAGDA